LRLFTHWVARARCFALASAGKIPLVQSFMARRVAKIGTPEAIAAVVAELAKSKKPETQLLLLSAIEEGLRGRRQVPMPEGWAAISSSLVESANADVNAQATALALKFGDPAALSKLRGVLVDSKKPVGEREQALEALLGVLDPELAPTLHGLIADQALRAGALRGLASYDHEGTPKAILEAYKSLNLNEKRDALNTLAARVPYASALLSAALMLGEPPLWKRIKTDADVEKIHREMGEVLSGLDSSMH